MSAPTKQTAARRPASPKANSRVTQYVDQQLEKTRRQVKSTDLIAAGLSLVVMVVGFLLAAAVVDAWVFTLTPLLRWSALLLLVAGCVSMMVFTIWPLLTKKINPDYAAKMLEDSKPGFRNSVLNYVWFRKKPDGIRSAVFDAVARQAAVDLNAVPADSSVDRSKVIRLGFWLVGVTAAFILYFMLSPKNPFQTLNRVLFPSADLAKPAVVTISDITPGSTSVFFGDQVEITAKVYGPHSPEEVQLIYSTNDGRQSGQVMLMQPDPTTPRQYKLDLTKNTGGLRESVEYEIVARDGQSGKFKIKVAPRPAITIESIYIESPKYTKLKPQTTLQGAIDGVEGAKVTLNAAANLEIEHATIEFLKQRPTAPNKDQEFDLVRAPIEMDVNSKTAKVNFLLTLDTNRENPFATHYRLNFNSVAGESPEALNVYPIRIIPDLAPELEIRNPTAPESKVAVNGRLAVVATANDLDYQISVVGLNIERRGNEILSKSFPLKAQASSGQKAQVQYEIKPQELGLRVGDQCIFYLTASDNRTTYFSDSDPAPNVTRSKNYSFTVTEADKSADSQPNKNPKTDPPPSDSDPDKNSKQPPESSEENSLGDESDESAKEGGEGSNDSEPDDVSEASDDSKSDDGKESGDGDNSDDGGGNGDPEQNNQSKEGDDNSESSQQNSNSNQPSKDSQSDPSDSGSEGSSDPQPSKENSAGSDPDSNSEGGEDSEPDPQDGGGGPPEQQQQDPVESGGSGGSESEAGNTEPENRHEGSGGGAQRPSDSDPNSDASDARAGNDPSAGNSSDTAPEQRDDRLTQGDEQLSDDASEAEQVQRLEELLSENPKLSEKAAEKEQSNPEQSSSGEDTSEGDESSKDGDPNASQDKNAAEKPNSAADPDNNSEPPNGAGNQPDSNQPDPNQNQQNTGNGEENTGSQSPNSQGPNSQSPSSQNQSPQASSNQDPSGDGPSGDPKSNPSKSKDGTSANDPKSDEVNNQQNSGESSAKPESEQDSGQPSNSPDSQKSSDGESANNNPSDPKGGNQSKSDGQPANSEQSEKPSSDQGSPSEQPSDAGGEPGGQPSDSTSPGQPSEASPSDKPGQASSKPGESPGTEGGNGSGKGDTGSDTLIREKENLEYSRKKIDLLLDDLRSQRQNPNEELLRKMNWSKQDLNDFIDSHDEMRAAAEQGNVRAKRAYDRRLRSYGPRPNSKRRVVAGNEEEAGNVEQDGAVNQAPPEQKYDFNSFLQDMQRDR